MKLEQINLREQYRDKTGLNIIDFFELNYNRDKCVFIILYVTLLLFYIQ